MNSYAKNMYQWLKRKGYGPKYEHAGIYCIKIDNNIAYIGKSFNMLTRVSQHYVGIKTESEKKYRLLSEIQRNGHSINFDVLYNAKSAKRSELEEELGQKECEYIRKYRPILNTQIPKESDWHKYDVQKVDAKSILKSYSL